MKLSRNFEVSLGNFTTPEPLETLINLNVFHSVLTDLDPSSSDRIKAFPNSASSMMLKSQNSLPYSIRCKLLSDIGFSNREIAEILLDFHLTNVARVLDHKSPDYASVMRQRLALLEGDAHKLGVVDPVNVWNVLNNW